MFEKIPQIVSPQVVVKYDDGLSAINATAVDGSRFIYPNPFNDQLILTGKLIKQ